MSFAGSRFRQFALFSAAALLTSASALAQSPLLSPHVPEIVSSGKAARVADLNTSGSLHLVLSLPLHNEAGLDALIADLYDPASPNFHHYLQPADFDARFGPTESDYATLTSWAQRNGLAITSTVGNRRLIEVDASVDTVNRAFHVTETTFHDAVLNRDFFAPDREPTVDLPIGLLAVGGLDNATPKYTQLKKGPISAGEAAGLPGTIAAPVFAPNAAGNAQTVFAGSTNNPITPHISGSGPGNTYTPSDMRAAYYGSGSLTGAGQTVGVFSYDGYLTSDVTAYYSKIGMSSSVPIKNVLVGGYAGKCYASTNGTSGTCDDGEQILDIVNVIGMAPGLTQVLFYESTSSTSELNQMVTDNIAKVITSSWGGGDFGTASDTYFKQMATQGITYLNATGDSGAFNTSTYGPPSLDPYIVQVGGTDLTTTSAGGAWSSETGWVDSGGGFLSTSSGGYTIPTWQQTSGVITSTNKGSTSYRNSPDMAAEGNFDNTTEDNGAFQTGYGGTSYATPRVAGYIALANQQSVANGKSTLGFINPTLYTLGLGSTKATVYHDITSGTNPSGSGTSTTYSAVAGYDLVTGWGSPNGTGLINALAGSGSTGTADYSLAMSSSTTTVAAGSTATNTVVETPVNGFTSTVTYSASGLPTGVTASFTAVDSTHSTITLTASASAVAGSSTVTVTGVSGSLSHSTTFTLTVTTGGKAPAQLIVNGGFESGAATPWTLSSGVLCTVAACGGSAHAGTYFAYLDGYGSAHTDTASQTVTIPSGYTKATLTFYLYINTAETTTTSKYDTLVLTATPSGGSAATVASFSNLNASSGYVVHTYDLSSYIGKTITLLFTGKEDSSLQTSFLLDDVALNVQ